MQWDVFCRVIDNHGDIGVCWRLAADLASRGERVHLWVDDPGALVWMAPRGAPGVDVQAWPDDARTVPIGDVVVEAFGCDLPRGVLQSIGARPVAPLWINLEYLSAEPYVERSHRLPSPQSHGAVAGLVKWFYYPGFTPKTGGLLREPGVDAARDRFDRGAWLASHGIGLRSGERLASVFCYPAAPRHRLAEAFASQPTLLLLAGGAQLPGPLPAGVRTERLPYLSQEDYDRLLWACDVNFVRGEDSFVRAQWAGRPFVWNIYPQDDGAHAAKLHAFLDRFLAGVPAGIANPLRRWWTGWNGLAELPGTEPDWAAWAGPVQQWRSTLHQQDDLVTGLLKFVAESR